MTHVVAPIKLSRVNFAALISDIPASIGTKALRIGINLARITARAPDFAKNAWVRSRFARFITKFLSLEKSMGPVSFPSQKPTCDPKKAPNQIIKNPDQSGKKLSLFESASPPRKSRESPGRKESGTNAVSMKSTTEMAIAAQSPNESMIAWASNQFIRLHSSLRSARYQSESGKT